MEPKKYPSDINREQIEKIKPILDSARKCTKPRTVDRYNGFCGLSSVLKTGCQWRMLPTEYPKWRTIHEYLLNWSRTPSPYRLSTLKQASGECGVVEPGPR